MAVYRQGLNGEIIKKLAYHDKAALLDTLIHLLIKLDNTLKEKFPKPRLFPYLSVQSSSSERNNAQSAISQNPQTYGTEPFMSESRIMRGAGGIHYAFIVAAISTEFSNAKIVAISLRNASHQVSLTTILAIPPILLPVAVHYAIYTFHLSAMIDSGSAGYFIDQDVANKLQLPLSLLGNLPWLCAIDEAPIGKGMATHCISPITLQTSWFIRRKLRFYSQTLLDTSLF